VIAPALLGRAPSRGAQIFFRHYAPRLEAGGAIGPRGWFDENTPNR
jgi:hypothetical protein